MKNILLALAFICTVGMSGQSTSNSSQCSNGRSLCGALGNSFINTTGLPNNSSPGEFGCLASQPNPAWFYLPVGQGGTLEYLIEQVDFNGNGLDVDFVCYGPFNSISEICENHVEDYIVDCSYSTDPVETVRIDNANPGEYYLLMVTNYSDDPGTITINETSNNQGFLTCSGLRMHAFLDSNSNGIKEDAEIGFNLGSFTYEANNNGIIHTLTDPDGLYGLYDENISNTYDISFTLSSQYSSYFNVTTPSYSNVLVQPGTAIVTYYFPVTVTQAYQDLSVHVIPNSSPRPGFTYKNTIVYSNRGNTTVANGTISFTKDPLVTISNISQAGITTTPTGFDFNFTNLLPYQTRIIEVTMQVPTMPAVMLGDLLTSTASIIPVTGDINQLNNTSSSTEAVIGSYDPNDKMEAHGEKIIFNEFGVNEYLYYTIRFQNTGTASAEFVKIQDVLDAQLDPASVEMIRASHNYSLDRVNNTLTWRFNDINLPHTTANEPESHGYVYFRVKPIPSFGVGDVIPNTASIFFDYNPPIITNTFNTEFVTLLGNKDIAGTTFSLYPNPAEKTVYLQLGTTTDSIKSVRIYDLTGKTLYFQEDIHNSNIAIDVNAFGTGVYLVDVLTSSNTKMVRKLLVK